METSIHEHCKLKSLNCELKSYSIIHDWWHQASGAHHALVTTNHVILPNVSDDAGSWIHHSLQLVCYDPVCTVNHQIAYTQLQVFCLCTVSQKTIVDTRCHKCLHEGFSRPNIQRLPDTMNLSEMKEAGSTDSWDVSVVSVEAQTESTLQQTRDASGATWNGLGWWPALWPGMREREREKACHMYSVAEKSISVA